MAYLLMDLDNTILSKQQIDDIGYKIVSKKVLGREISMLKHPVTGEPDKEFTKHSNHEIWEYKIQQVKENNENLGNAYNIDQLVGMAGAASCEYIRRGKTWKSKVDVFLQPVSVKKLRNATLDIGVATSGAKEVQTEILSQLGYFEAGINPELSTYADEGQDKIELIQRSISKYLEINSGLPKMLIYIGDSAKDMEAVRIIQDSEMYPTTFIPIAVLTGNNNSKELFESGALAVFSTLKNHKNIDALNCFVRKFK